MREPYTLQCRKPGCTETFTSRNAGAMRAAHEKKPHKRPHRTEGGDTQITDGLGNARRVRFKIGNVNEAARKLADSMEAIHHAPVIMTPATPDELRQVGGDPTAHTLRFCPSCGVNQQIVRETIAGQMMGGAVKFCYHCGCDLSSITF